MCYFTYEINFNPLLPGVAYIWHIAKILILVLRKEEFVQ